MVTWLSSCAMVRATDAKPGVVVTVQRPSAMAPLERRLADWEKYGLLLAGCCPLPLAAANARPAVSEEATMSGLRIKCSNPEGTFHVGCLEGVILSTSHVPTMTSITRQIVVLRNNPPDGP